MFRVLKQVTFLKIEFAKEAVRAFGAKTRISISVKIAAKMFIELSVAIIVVWNGKKEKYLKGFVKIF